VVVKEGAGRWQAESGQYLLAFEGDPAAGALKVIARETRSVGDYVDRGFALHEAGRLADAEALYREALGAHGEDPLVLFNLGVLLEDLERKAEAAECYQAALRRDARMADCHYNLALLSEALARPRDAIRHMAQYRKLVAKK
jgi:tetratricopeptide (TPR) repeat protein